MLSVKLHRALIKAKLEPYLAFLHSVQYDKSSLVCDLMELYRYLFDAFQIVVDIIESPYYGRFREFNNH
jgi:CRISPR/Cas system-associated endonuclease Cas1